MTQPCKFAAKVTQEGVLQVAEPLIWKASLARLRGQVVYVMLERLKHTRSAQQNRRYWGLLVPLAAEVLGAARDLPISNEMTHEVLKGAFIGYEDTALGKVPKASRTLNTEAFADYCRKVEHWLLHDHGIVVPEKGESLEEAIA